ncbi:MAG: sigma-70 family RNA polymerase sigma factor [Ginsengibacter sp.]
MDKNETFITAIKKNEGLIYKIAGIYTNDIEDRNDLVQEIIYQLWKSFDSFSQNSSLSTWMYRVAMNVAIYHLKITRRKVLTVPMEEKFLDFHETDNSNIEEKLQAFRQHLNNLNLLDKGIVILYLENKSYEEISEIVGISISNVGTKLSRIKEKLKTQISKKL